MKLLYLSFAILLLRTQSILAQNETENWKLFKSKENHFSIKFPDYCTEIVTYGAISDSSKATIKENGILQFSVGVKKYSVLFSNKVIPIYGLTIYYNPEKIEIKEFICKIIIDNLSIYQESDITIESFNFESHNAYKATYENQVGGYTGIKSELFIQRNYEIIRFDIYNTLNETYEKLFDKLVSTIKIYN